jgi:hypothetical protein
MGRVSGIGWKVSLGTLGFGRCRVAGLRGRTATLLHAAWHHGAVHAARNTSGAACRPLRRPKVRFACSSAAA